MASLSKIKARIPGVRDGLNSFLYPAGIEVLAASGKILLNILNARLADVGMGRELNCCSVRAMKEVQSARWKLVKVRFVRICG